MVKSEFLSKNYFFEIANLVRYMDNFYMMSNFDLFFALFMISFSRTA